MTDNSFDNLCRLCLQLSDESSVDLFELKNGHLVADLVQVICPIVIDRSERNLPQRICCDCLDLLIDAIHLRHVSLINDKELRKKSENLDDQTEMIIEDDEEQLKTSKPDESKQTMTDFIYIEALDEVLDDGEISNSIQIPIIIEHIPEVISKPKQLPTSTNYCELCDNFFCNASSFKRHQLRRHKQVCYSCDLCIANFKTKRDLEKHMNKRHLMKHPEIRYLYSERLTLDLSELYEKLDEPEAITCTFCSYTDHDEDSLNSHLRTHQAIVDSGKMYCRHCPTAIETMDFMIEHARSHNEPLKTHRCLICSKTFPFGEKFKNHLRNHKKNQHKVCFCPLCGRKFSKSQMLKDHINFIHNKESMFICPNPDCAKRFGSKSALNGHVKRHIEGNKYLCPFCPKSFSSHNLLNNHKVVHTKDRPFACNFCNKTFKQQKVLNDHLKRHDDNAHRKLYVCSICNRSLMTSYALVRHMKGHTGDKPYKCDFCVKSYAQKNDLNKHFRSHVGANTYFCDFPHCDQAFRIQAELKFHQGSHYVQMS